MNSYAIKKDAKNNLIKNIFRPDSSLKIKILPYIFLSLIFWVLILPLIIKPEINTLDDRDEKAFHYPTILTFTEQVPYVDLVNYRSATTPLYHLSLAVSTFIFGSDIIPLRLLNATISLVCLLVVYGYFSTRGDTVRSLYFAIVFMLSAYFVGPAVRLSTDNAALLFVFLSIYTMGISSPNNQNSILTNFLIACTILIRQIYAWLIGAYIFYLFLVNKFKQQNINLASNILPILIPITGLVFFLFLWKGLTPPLFSAHTGQKLNWDAPIYIVSLIGLYEIFFCFWLFKVYRNHQVKLLTILLLISLAFGFLLLHPVSNEYRNFDESLGKRGGSLWVVASLFPNLLSSAIVFWILFPVGLVCLYGMVRYLASRQDYLIIICFSLWLMASVMSTRTYQKYYEPFILFFMGYAMVPLKIEERWYHYIGPASLLLGFAAIALVRFLLG